jgi:phosphatidylglycerol---prolipoprotein diacylglyceryl transferase
MRWDVDPVLFSAGPLQVRWYGAFFAAAFLFGFLLMRWVYRREGRPEADLDGLFLSALVGGVVGARLAHVVVYEPARFLADPLEVFALWRGGLASHGGAAGIVLAIWLHCRRRPDRPFLATLDRAALVALPGGALIRVGNLFNSEIVGHPTDVPWAVVFARLDPLPRHPAQVYEALAYAAIFAVLLTLYRRRGRELAPGVLLGWTLVLAFTARTLVEFVKTPQAEWETSLPVTAGQLLSLVPVALGVWLLVRARARAAG